MKHKYYEFLRSNTAQCLQATAWTLKTLPILRPAFAFLMETWLSWAKKPSWRQRSCSRYLNFILKKKYFARNTKSPKWPLQISFPNWVLLKQTWFCWHFLTTPGFNSCLFALYIMKKLKYASMQKHCLDYFVFSLV